MWMKTVWQGRKWLIGSTTFLSKTLQISPSVTLLHISCASLFSYLWAHPCICHRWCLQGPPVSPALSFSIVTDSYHCLLHEQNILWPCERAQKHLYSALVKPTAVFLKDPKKSRSSEAAERNVLTRISAPGRQVLKNRDGISTEQFMRKSFSPEILFVICSK